MRNSSLISAMCVALLAFTGCQAGHPHHPVAVSDAEAIYVTGEGDASAPPDRMRLNLGVEAKSETLEAAMRDCKERSTALEEALFKLGVQKKDVKTGQFSISQQREPVVVSVVEAAPAAAPAAAPGKAKAGAVVAPPPPPRMEERWIERYVVNNTLEVVYPDLTRAGELISAAVAAGANNSWGISFEVTDPKPLEAKARDAAIDDAKVRAQQIADKAGVKLGRVLSVSEGGGGGPVMPMPMYKAAAMEASMPIEGGESKLHATVQVAYAIER